MTMKRNRSFTPQYEMVGQWVPLTPEEKAEQAKQEQAAADESHAGFEVRCGNCDSTVVAVESHVGFSAQSGSWGEVKLVCKSCGAETDIWRAY